MSRRMLINAQIPEEVRVAILKDKTLENFQMEAAESGLERGNIYRGIVVSIQANLNAAFVDYGGEKDGFLTIQDVVPEAFHQQPKEGSRKAIQDVLERNRSVLVQVTREAEGKKGAVLTTDLGLAGRYLVFSPFDDTRGVSRKVEDDDTRKQLKDLAKGMDVPSGSGVIVRTNALDQNKRDLNRDLNHLLRLWRRIRTEAGKGKGPKLIFSDQDLILRALRDYLDSSIDEVLVDEESSFERTKDYLRALMPRTKINITRYQEKEPLFSRFGLEDQIDRIYERVVPLPSGGSIVIDGTEALVAIDVNSGRTRGGSRQEDTAIKTNLEAAKEVARQLALRDMGGLVVVDFIDMRSARNRREVEKTLKEALRSDKARCYVGRISSNGLLEINRQRIQQALHMRTHRPCPTCSGTGRIASPEKVGLDLVRRIRARAATTPLAKVRASLHPELADAIQNDRRAELSAIEEEFSVRVEVIASSRLHRSEQEIDWFERTSEKDEEGGEARPKAAVTASEVVDLHSGERRSKKQDGSGGARGRRRGGRKPGRSRQSPAQSATPDESDKDGDQKGSDGGSDGGSPGGKPRRSRRRRSRRSRKKKSSAPAEGNSD